VSSFTRAAAHEIASREIPVDEDNVGTLHALCYRALDRPELTEGRLAEWNKEHPHLSVSAGKIDPDEPMIDLPGMTDGDALSLEYHRARARMIPREIWSAPVRSWAARWEAWKEHNELMDFTDLIDVALRDRASPNYTASVGFFDEAQDFTKLQMTLVRQWAERMEYVLLAGDDDQLLYNFAGATPDAFLEPPIPDKYKEVLAQSYRVPRAVHKITASWIEQVTRREPKEYRPRDADGAVAAVNATYMNPIPLMAEIDRAERDDKTLMFLASCGYMLHPFIAMLREEGVPYHNPYRRRRGDWNPLRWDHRRKRMTAAMRLADFLFPALKDVDGSRIWSIPQLAAWIAPLTAKGLLKPGAKRRLNAALKDTDGDADEYVGLVEELFVEPTDAWSQSFEPDPRWFGARLLASKRPLYEFPLTVAIKRGPARLKERPRVVVGTVHSVKGGEADTVIVCPDLSTAGMREWMAGGTARDAVVRMFYVAMSRARERLVLCDPATGYHVNLKGR